MQLKQCSTMTAIRTVHRVHKTQVIHTLANLRKEVTHLYPALAIALECKGAWEEGTGFAFGLDATARDGLTCVLC